jgi:5-methylcytosine-specific restriction endonuclease McrA
MLIGPDSVCAKCHRPGTLRDPLQLDHIIPLSLGGSHDLSNLQILHRSENIRKGGANRLRHK